MGLVRRVVSKYEMLEKLWFYVSTPLAFYDGESVKQQVLQQQ